MGNDNVKDYPPYLDYPKERKPITNADRIRAMPDEELAEFLYNAWDNAAWCSDKRCTEDDSCLPCWLKWLREECNE